jgi:hypothetical protein
MRKLFAFLRKFTTPAALLQLFIFLGTLFSVTLVNIPGALLPAQIIGLVIQPAWMFTSYKSKQWGPFALSFYFLIMWSFGIYKSLNGV